MLDTVKNFIQKKTSDDDGENSLHLTYQSIPATFELRKRRYEEEQIKTHKIKKQKYYEM